MPSGIGPTCDGRGYASPAGADLGLRCDGEGATGGGEFPPMQEGAGRLLALPGNGLGG